MTEDEMVGWHGHEFEQTLGDRGGQGSLACCSPWDCKESDTTEQLNNNIFLLIIMQSHHSAVLMGLLRIHEKEAYPS